MGGREVSRGKAVLGATEEVAEGEVEEEEEEGVVCEVLARPVGEGRRGRE